MPPRFRFSLDTPESVRASSHLPSGQLPARASGQAGRHGRGHPEQQRLFESVASLRVVEGIAR